MRSSLICGTSHFPEEEFDVEELLSPCKVPKRPSKKIKDSENPFTNSGIDKFNALLDELERKKQQIYTQKGSQDISFIRFAYSSSGDWKPIVVKSRNRIRSDDEHHMHINADKEGIVKNVNHEASKHVDDHEVVNHEKRKVGKMTSEGPNKERGSRRSREIVKLEKLSQPSCYVLVMFILIMLFLTIFGRTFTILCTSLGWYLVPLVQSSSSDSSSSLKLNMDKAKMKKVYSVITSSPHSVLSGPLDKSPTAKHAHRKSW